MLRPTPLVGPRRNSGSRFVCSSSAAGALYLATTLRSAPSHKPSAADSASQRRVAFSSMAWNTGSSSPGELEMTRNTSEVAVCCSSASARCSRASTSSCLYFSTCCSRSARGLRIRSTRALAFVPVERSLRPRVGLFAPLRDKVTSSAQSLVPLPVGPAKDRAYQSLTHDELASSLGHLVGARVQHWVHLDALRLCSLK